jgi:hypothetical protein
MDGTVIYLEFLCLYGLTNEFHNKVNHHKPSCKTSPFIPVMLPRSLGLYLEALRLLSEESSPDCKDSLTETILCNLHPYSRRQN